MDLLPLPRLLEERAGVFSPGRRVAYRAPAELEGPAFECLRAEFSAQGTTLLPAEDAAVLHFELAEGCELGAEGYRLEITVDGIEVRARELEGLRHAARTLTQVVASSPHDGSTSLPCLLVEDAPSFPRRAILLDISRDRVPTMETLFALVERFAAWKLNELQLYTEHTFAHPGCEEVWGDASPITPEELRALDEHCEIHGMRLIANQQCLGHMHRWLVHPRFRALAECPEGVEHPFSLEPEPFSLCPTDPLALEFAGRLADEVLRHVRTREINVGGDETFDLGSGRSSGRCEAIDAEGGDGVGEVYAEFLSGLGERLTEQGVRMQVFADVVLAHPGLEAKLPADAILLLWGYEADHPFEEEGARVAASGHPFLVCPGTGSWLSIAGRLENAAENIAAAARVAKARGAVGLMTCDWGDRGHLQPLPASYPGFVLAADLAWNADAPRERRAGDAVASLVARHAFGPEVDPNGRLAGALVRLARLAAATGARSRNASPLFLALTEIDTPFPPERVQELTGAGLERALGEIASTRQELAAGRATSDEAKLVGGELGWCADVLEVGARLALARMRHRGKRVSDLPSSVRADLAARLAGPIERHRALWLARSRPGGQLRSVAWLKRLETALRS